MKWAGRPCPAGFVSLEECAADAREDLDPIDPTRRVRTAMSNVYVADLVADGEDSALSHAMAALAMEMRQASDATLQDAHWQVWATNSLSGEIVARAVTQRLNLFGHFMAHDSETPGAMPTCYDMLGVTCLGHAFHADFADVGWADGLFFAMAVDSLNDLWFPQQEVRVPMRPGRLVIFDQTLPHGLVKSGAPAFRESDFAQRQRNEHDCLISGSACVDPSHWDVLGVCTGILDAVRRRVGMPLAVNLEHARIDPETGQFRRCPEVPAVD